MMVITIIIIIIVVIIIVVVVVIMVEYLDRKEEPLIQIVGTHKYSINSAMLQTARCLKTEVQRRTRQIKDSIAEKQKKNGEGRGAWTIVT
jgi:ubiquinone biosynthesis protein UbiJ